MLLCKINHHFINTMYNCYTLQLLKYNRKGKYLINSSSSGSKNSVTTRKILEVK